jgi:hypothetical protein
MHQFLKFIYFDLTLYMFRRNKQINKFEELVHLVGLLQKYDKEVVTVDLSVCV